MPAAFDWQAIHQPSGLTMQAFVEAEVAKGRNLPSICKDLPCALGTLRRRFPHGKPGRPSGRPGRAPVPAAVPSVRVLGPPLPAPVPVGSNPGPAVADQTAPAGSPAILADAPWDAVIAFLESEELVRDCQRFVRGWTARERSLRAA